MAQIQVSSDPSLWFSGRQPTPGAQVRLFCFPYAGVGTSVFRAWPGDFAGHVDVLPVQLPGRESRYHEAPFRRMSDLVGATLAALTPCFDVPFALAGHSFGAAVAFEIARQLPAGLPLRRVFVSARRAPHVPDRQSPISHLPGDQFLTEVLRRYDGIPAAVLQSPELLELLLPRLRADLELLETHSCTPIQPIDAPISVFGGSRDPGVSLADLGGWREHSRAGVRIRVVQGPHLFLQSQRVALQAAIAADLGLERAVGVRT